MSPLPSVSLSREHITEAFAKSPDHGATLDLAHKNITDVGEDGAEELATVGREDDDEGDSMLVRCVCDFYYVRTGSNDVVGLRSHTTGSRPSQWRSHCCHVSVTLCSRPTILRYFPTLCVPSITPNRFGS